MTSLTAMIFALLLPVTILLLGFVLLMRGWDRLAQQRWLQGCGCVFGGMALGVLALSLTRLAEQPQQWTEVLQWLQ